MRAYRLTAWKSEPELVDVADPEPGPGQVVVRVGGAGACHSDLHLMHDFDGAWPVPFTIGHENAGWVHAVGPGTSGVEIGQPVAVYGAWGCGTCRRCRAGIENYCENPLAAPVPGGGCGLGADGGMAEYVLVPEARHLVPLPDGLSPVAAAPLTDAGLTPYHAIKRSLPKLAPTSTVMLIGVGGLGHLALQIAKALCAARVVAVDSRPEALDLARHLGADEVLGPDEAAGSMAGRADVVLDFVGVDATIALAVGSARPLADITLVGIGGGSYPFGFFSAPYGASLQSTYWGSRSELGEVLDLGARGLVTAEITTFPLERAAEAYHAMRDGHLQGRAVVVPG